jgi:copper resistance protein B
VIRAALGCARRCGTLIAAAVGVSSQAVGQETTDAPAAASPAELSAAFPDLGGMEAREMMMEDPFERFVLFDQLEIQGADQILSWDFKAWAGRDLNKLLVRSEGEHESGSTADAELELLWSHTIGSWWDLVAGIRHDFEPGPSRSWAAFGIQGLAPYAFDVEATAYVGRDSRASVRLEAEYELLITQRLVLQPLAELDWYSKGDTQRGIGSGLSKIELGLRLRYEIRREIAPYVGIVRARTFGQTADLARLAGADSDETRVLAGVRVWF